MLKATAKGDSWRCSKDKVVISVKRVVNDEMNEALDKEPNAKEILEALQQMHPTKAPGPDGMHALFFQKFWNVVGHDVVSFIIDWWHGRADLNAINSTHIALIPKVNDPKHISEFRPISLCNVIYKIVTKMLANRLKIFLPQIVSENQSAFVPKRLITDNALIALEVFHAMKRKVGGRNGCYALKLDMSKAYDRVEWAFVEKVMARMGFSMDWVNRIISCISSARFSFIINGAAKGFVVPSRGLRQGDPISPYIFILCAEAFSTLLCKAADEKEIHGVSVCRGAPTISHLFFADDSIIFGRANLHESSKIADILRTYEKASGQKINLDKSEISFSKNVDEMTREAIKACLQVKEVDRHQKYLGLSTLIGRSKKAIFAGIKERVWKKLQGWKEKLLSKPGKEILIKAVAQAIPTYVMGIFKIPDGIIEEIQGMLARFWWGSKDQERKMHWIKWEKLCMPKSLGGLGFRDLKVFNLAFLAKQGWRLIQNDQSLLSKVLKARYFKNTDFLEARLGFDPSFSWRSIWGAKSLLLEGIKWRVGNGAKINVWNDAWLPSRSSSLVPTPNLNADPNMIVAELIDQQKSCWDLVKVRSIMIEADVEKILGIPLSNRLPVDENFWWPARDGNFSTKSCYWLGKLGHLRSWQEACGGENEQLWKSVWRMEGPPKLHHFAWRALVGAMAVKENLRRRHIVESGTCPLCNHLVEDLHHALFECTEAARVWEGSNFSLLVRTAPVGSFLEKIKWLMERVERKETAKLFTLAWAAWTHRNEKIFRNPSSNTALIVSGLLKLVTDHEQYAKRVFDRLPARRLPSIRYWRVPPHGTVKINSDDCCAHSGWIGLGVVIRDDLGSLKAAAIRRMEATVSPAEAEALAARFGLQVANQLGFSRVLLETDAASVINGCRPGLLNKTPVGILYSDIMYLSLSFVSFDLCHLKRGGNTVAHLAARIHPENGEEQVFTCNFPQGLLDLVELDFC